MILPHCQVAKQGLLETSKDYMDKAHAVLQAMAGGAAAGADWLDGKVNADFENIMGHAESSLLQQDGKQLVDAIASLSKAWTHGHEADDKRTNNGLPAET